MRSLTASASTAVCGRKSGARVGSRHPETANAYRRAYEPGSDATFIGNSPRGLQLRVSYFDGIELLPPVAAVVASPAASAE